MVLHIFIGFSHLGGTPLRVLLRRRGYSDTIAYPPSIWKNGCFASGSSSILSGLAHGLPGKCRLLRQMSFPIGKFIKTCQKSCHPDVYGLLSSHSITDPTRTVPLFYGGLFFDSFRKFFYQFHAFWQGKIQKRDNSSPRCSVWNTIPSSQLHSWLKSPWSVSDICSIRSFFHRFP